MATGTFVSQNFTSPAELAVALSSAFLDMLNAHDIVAHLDPGLLARLRANSSPHNLDAAERIVGLLMDPHRTELQRCVLDFVAAKPWLSWCMRKEARARYAHRKGTEAKHRGAQNEAAGLYEDASRIWNEVGDAKEAKISQACAMFCHARAALSEQRFDDAAKLHSQEGELWKEVGHERTARVAVACGLHCRARLAIGRGDFDGGMARYREEAEVWTALGSAKEAQVAEACGINCQAKIAFREGRFEDTIALYAKESSAWRRMAKETEARFAEACALHASARMALRREDFEKAMTEHRAEAAAWAALTGHEHEVRVAEACALHCEGRLAAKTERFDDAATFYLKEHDVWVACGDHKKREAMVALAFSVDCKGQDEERREGWKEALQSFEMEARLLEQLGGFEARMQRVLESVARCRAQVPDLMRNRSPRRGTTL